MAHKPRAWLSEGFPGQLCKHRLRGLGCNCLSPLFLPFPCLVTTLHPSEGHNSLQSDPSGSRGLTTSPLKQPLQQVSAASRKVAPCSDLKSQRWDSARPTPSSEKGSHQQRPACGCSFSHGYDHSAKQGSGPHVRGKARLPVEGPRG